ncbi:hypothetical protein Dimus_010065 [Dionaea muscipula]
MDLEVVERRESVDLLGLRNRGDDDGLLGLGCCLRRDAYGGVADGPIGWWWRWGDFGGRPGRMRWWRGVCGRAAAVKTCAAGLGGDAPAVPAIVAPGLEVGMTKCWRGFHYIYSYIYWSD